MTQPAVFVPGVNIFGVPLQFQVDVAPQAEILRGNHQWEDSVFVEHCFVFDLAPQSGESNVPEAPVSLLYVPRDSGVEDNMRFEFQGLRYGVFGPPRYNYLHGFTQENFGYVEFTIAKGGR